MATGDVTISVAVAGGVAKTVTLASATRVKNKLYRTSEGNDLSVDANWQLDVVNGWAGRLIEQANSQLEIETTITRQTFTAAS